MEVKTNNPVIVNGTKESQPSKYLAFDANGKPEKIKQDEVKSFQGFANSKGANLTIDGAWGAKTESAWSKYGAEYVASMKAMSNKLFMPSPSSATPSKEAQIEQAKKGKVWSVKAKAWITSDKAKDTLKMLQESGGVLGFIKGVIGIGGGQSQSSPDVMPSEESYTEAPKEGMSTGAKIGIAVGGAVVLGLIIYAVIKKK